MEEFSPAEFQGNTLTLKQTKDFVFNKDIIKRGSNIIQQEQTKILGNPFKLKFIEADKPAIRNKTETEDSEEINSNNEKVFNKVVDLFDGEILQ